MEGGTSAKAHLESATKGSWTLVQGSAGKEFFSAPHHTLLCQGWIHKSTIYIPFLASVLV